MKRIVLIYGLIAGFIVSATMSISMFTSYNNPGNKFGTSSMIIGYLSMIVAFSLIYVGVKNYRDNYQEGVISFGKAFRIGLFVTLIASTMYVIVWAIMYNFFMPDFMEVYTAQILKQAAATATPAEMQQKIAEVASYKDVYKSPVLFTLFTYLEILPVGLIVSLIAALILKRRKGREIVSIA